MLKEKGIHLPADASKVGVVAVLKQVEDECQQPINYFFGLSILKKIIQAAN